MAQIGNQFMLPTLSASPDKGSIMLKPILLPLLALFSLNCAPRPSQVIPNNEQVKAILQEFSNLRVRLYLNNGEAADNATLLSTICRQKGLSFNGFKSELEKTQPEVYEKFFPGIEN